MPEVSSHCVTRLALPTTGESLTKETRKQMLVRHRALLLFCSRYSQLRGHTSEECWQQRQRVAASVSQQLECASTLLLQIRNLKFGDMKHLLWDHTVWEKGPEGSSDRLTAKPILSHFLCLPSTPPSADCWYGQMGRVGREVPYWGHPVTTRVCRWIAFTYRVMLIVCVNVWSGSWQVRLGPVHGPGSGVRLSPGEASVGCWGPKQ